MKTSRVVGIIVLISILRLIYIYYSPISLYADEAQYHYWSLNPDFGYYSKPPMIAWLIGISTKIFGHSEFGIKFFSPILYGLSAFFIHLIQRHLKIGSFICSSIIFLTLPCISIGSFMMSTDAPLILFYSMSLYFYIKILDEEKIYYWLLGISIGLGMLSKYNMGLFAVGILFHQVIIHRNLLIPFKNLVVPGLISLIIFIPNIIWNYKNGFVSIMHTADITKLDRSYLYPDKMVLFILSQFLMAGPIIYYYAIQTMFRNKFDTISVITFITIFPILLLSLISGANGNWAMPSMTAVALLCVFGSQKLIKISMWCNIAFMIFLYAGTFLGLDKIKPFQRVMGYNQYGKELDKIHKNNPKCKIIFDDRKSIAWALYYSSIPHNYMYKLKPYEFPKDHFEMTMPFDQLKVDLKNNCIMVVSLNNAQPSWGNFKEIANFRVNNTKHGLYYVFKSKY